MGTAVNSYHRPAEFSSLDHNKPTQTRSSCFNGCFIPKGITLCSMKVIHIHVHVDDLEYMAVALYVV